MAYVSLPILSVLFLTKPTPLTCQHVPPTLPDRHILKVAGRLEESRNILDNNPAAGMARAVAKAWELYASPR